MKIYFASDAHLGARFHKDPLAIEKKLVRWLDSWMLSSIPRLPNGNCLMTDETRNRSLSL